MVSMFEAMSENVLRRKELKNIKRHRRWNISKLHNGYGEQSPATKKIRRENSASQGAEGIDMSGGRSLVSRLRLDPNKDANFVPLPMQLLHKYIAYARTFVFPRISKPATEILEKFYLKLRDHATSADSTPILGLASVLACMFMWLNFMWTS